MNAKPIIFQGPMIRALLAGRKTQTRRVIKAPRWSAQDEIYLFAGEPCVPDDDETTYWIECPYGQPGDLLWVREAYRLPVARDEMRPGDIRPSRFMVGLEGDELICYEADESFNQWLRPEAIEMEIEFGRYRHARFMPRWASRLTLELTDVRVQMVQDIRDRDAQAEGVTPAKTRNAVNSFSKVTYLDHVSPFKSLWNSINTKPGHGWDDNPWVWALTFVVHKQNVDDVIARMAQGAA